MNKSDMIKVNERPKNKGKPYAMKKMSMFNALVSGYWGNKCFPNQEFCKNHWNISFNHVLLAFVCACVRPEALTVVTTTGADRKVKTSIWLVTAEVLSNGKRWRNAEFSTLTVVLEWLQLGSFRRGHTGVRMLSTRKSVAVSGHTGAQSGEQLRQGLGVQEWDDGSRYEGKFVSGLKHGKGKYAWKSGEVKNRIKGHVKHQLRQLSINFCSIFSKVYNKINLYFLSVLKICFFYLHRA